MPTTRPSAAFHDDRSGRNSRLLAAPANELSTHTLTIVFVCTGNICRSAMADVMAQDAFEHAGLADDVRVLSCGTGSWHTGQGADRRAIEELARHGLDGTRHRANVYGDEFAGADLYLTMSAEHNRALRREGVDPSLVRLVRSFDPASPVGAEVDDPYYGGAEDFARTYDELSAALPGVVAWAARELRDRSDR